MQIGLGAVGFDFGIDQAAQADTERGEVGSEEFGVTDQREIGLQLGLLLADILGDGFATDLFFAFEDNFHVDRQFAVTRLHERFEGLHFHPELAFVVDCASRVNVVIALRRLEGGSLPFVERIGRLHVVVRVTEHGWLALGMEPVCIDKRMSLGRNDLNIFQTDAAQFVSHEVGGFLNVGFVLFEGADAGDTKKIL